MFTDTNNMSMKVGLSQYVFMPIAMLYGGNLCTSPGSKDLV